LTKEKFDVIINHSCWPQAIFGPVVKSKQLPLVFWCHDTPKGKHWLERWAKGIKPDLAIANSNYTLAAMPNLYPGVPSKTIYLPVPAPEIGDRASVRRAVRAELNAPEEATVIIQASRLERWKGQAALIAALGQLRDLPGWLCWIAGGAQRPHEAQYLQELEGQVRELGIGDRVRFLGQRTDVPHLLAAADIHCQPNTGPEPFGIAFIEALYAGLPVVTTAMGGGAEVVEDSCGRLVGPDDDKGLSEVLRLLIVSGEARASLGAEGPARAYQLCDPGRQLNRFCELLDEFFGREAAA
jgi:glycosyltransferase involved in cell wall biosynthesis